MNVNEKFIDKNIGQLCKDYDRIRGANVNLQRITCDIIDGLKPVQRRALYIMFLKNQGKDFRKLASISGDTFGRIHPHAPTSIDDAIVGLAQEWHNSIPLIEGKGNFGCHDDKTEVLTQRGWQYFRHLHYGDKLASVHPIRGEVIWERPKSIFKYEYDGNLIYFRDSHKSEYSSYDFMVTPNHRMLISALKFIEASVLKNTPAKIPLVRTSDISTSMTSIDMQWSDTSSLIVNEIPYKGYVYCAEVPTYNTLITRRNGKILISGNSLSGDPAGASRYIYAALSEYARACFFDDWKYSVVDMTMGYDEETKEPLYLPAKYPNILLNGCLGIGYGMASNIPCYNFKEVVNATILLMKDPKSNVVLIPDSPTGCDIVETNFAEISNRGTGAFTMRCKYEIDAENNTIKITALPYLVPVNYVREKIADIKEQGGLSELITMNDLSGKKVDLQLVIRDDVNPYKFMRKLIKCVAGLEKGYPVNITVVNNLENFDYSIKDLLLEWIKWRREQKRTVLTHKRTSLLAEQRTNDVKIFLMNKENLDETIKIFRTSKNRDEIEERLISKYHNSEIRMDSLQAKTVSNMRFYELSISSYEACLKRREELIEEIKEVEELVLGENSVDKVIIAELRDGIKRFGTPRKSNVVPYKIKVSEEVEGFCILQLSSDGNVIRKPSSNVYEEPVPTDSNGFAIKVDNDSSFILINEYGYHSFVRVKDIPIDSEVPLNRYMKKALDGKIVAMLPCDIESNKCCTLISKQGMLKRIRIADITPSKKPCIALNTGDTLVKGLVTDIKTSNDILIYTREGMGQRLDPNLIKITSPNAKGGNGFKLSGDDQIIGCYTINPEENQYICYVTMKGKFRLNLIDYLPMRTSKHDAMVRLIDIANRDKLIGIIGCNKLDKVQVYYNDESSEVIEIQHLEESTMGSRPKKVTTKDAVQFNIVKAKLV